MIFKYVFSKQLRMFGLDKSTIKTLTKELNAFLPHEFLYRKENKSLS